MNRWVLSLSLAALALALACALGAQRGRLGPLGSLAAPGEAWAGLTARASGSAASQAARQPSHTPPVPVPAPGTPGGAASGIARGTLAQASEDRVTLEMPGQEPMELDVGPGAAVLLDGRAASASQIPIGADVEARYRVEGDRVIATRIDARRPQPAPRPQSSAPARGVRA